MKKLVVLLLAGLLATSAFAIVDPDDNMLGIYFDVNADNNCYTTGIGAMFFGYLILTNTTHDMIEGYELALEVVPTVPASFFKMNEWYANDSALDLGSSGPLGGEYAVGLGTPIPASPAMVLHTWQWMLMADMTVDIYIRGIAVSSIPGSDLPVIGLLLGDGSSDLIEVGTSTGGIGIPVATINKDCVVAIEETSFGSVKSLFR